MVLCGLSPLLSQGVQISLYIFDQLLGVLQVGENLVCFRVYDLGIFADLAQLVVQMIDCPFQNIDLRHAENRVFYLLFVSRLEESVKLFTIE